MPLPHLDAPRYYCVTVANSGRVSLRWSAPLASIREAAAAAKAKLAAGDGTLAFVVEARGGRRRARSLPPLPPGPGAEASRVVPALLRRPRDTRPLPRPVPRRTGPGRRPRLGRADRRRTGQPGEGPRPGGARQEGIETVAPGRP